MKLFEHDYLVLTTEEEVIKNQITEKYTQKLGSLKIYNTDMFRAFPASIRHNNSLFPNNYLDIVELTKENKLKKINEKFSQLINEETTREIDVLRFIKENQAYHIIGSIFKSYQFGHHDAYLFREFQLGNSYQADYVLVGKSSDGYHFILIELESPNGRIMLKDDHFGDSIRKGLNQIRDWKSWIEANYSTLIESFEKETDKQLPKEFYKLDISRINYVVIAGRRNDYQENSYSEKRRLNTERIVLLHYDNLYDSAEWIIGQKSY